MSDYPIGTYATIRVETLAARDRVETLAAREWPVVERVAGGWQSGAMHYSDDVVRAVRVLNVLPDGRKVAAVIYEDELPRVTVNRHGGLDANNLSYGSELTSEAARSAALDYLALARHIEARDAANAEAEREVERKALGARAPQAEQTCEGGC